MAFVIEHYSCLLLELEPTTWKMLQFMLFNLNLIRMFELAWIGWQVTYSAVYVWVLVGLFPLFPLGAQGILETFFLLQFLNLRNSVGLLGWVIRPSHGRYLTQTQNKHRHPRLDWDSNPRSKRLTVRPLCSAIWVLIQPISLYELDWTVL
jgi:hypothetical protein